MAENLDEDSRRLGVAARVLEPADAAEVGHQVAQSAPVMLGQLRDHLGQPLGALLVPRAYIRK